MGNFANTLFSVLLGWVQSAAAWLWGLIGADGADGLMGWVLDHWLMLAICLCLLGVAVDLIVYVFRWQPYRVWLSFWRREPAEEAEPAAPVEEEPMQWVYATGETAPEPYPPVQAIPEEPTPQLAPERTVQRVIPARRRRTADGSVEYVLPPTGDVQQGYHQPYYPPQWHTSEHQPTDGGTQE